MIYKNMPTKQTLKNLVEVGQKILQDPRINLAKAYNRKLDPDYEYADALLFNFRGSICEIAPELLDKELPPNPIYAIQELVQRCKVGKPKAAKDEHLTVTETHQRTGLSRSRITQLCNSSEIISKGKGRKRKVSLNSTLQYIAKIAETKREKKTTHLGETAIKDAADEARDKARMDKIDDFQV